MTAESTDTENSGGTGASTDAPSAPTAETTGSPGARPAGKSPGGSGWELLEVLAAVILAAESLRIIGSLVAGILDGSAVPGVLGGPGQHQDNVEPQPCARGRGQPGVVALAGAAGDQRVRARGQGRAAEPLQFAYLVPPGAEAGEVIALHPEVSGPEPERTRQPGRGLEGSRPAPEGGGRHFLEFRHRHPLAISV